MQKLSFFALFLSLKQIFGLIVIREVAFVKRNATFVIETQVCNLKCTICKRNAIPIYMFSCKQNLIKKTNGTYVEYFILISVLIHI